MPINQDHEIKDKEKNNKHNTLLHIDRIAQTFPSKFSIANKFIKKWQFNQFYEIFFCFEGMTMMLLCSAVVYSNTPVFRADHPFFYIIFDTATKSPVFTGAFKPSI